MYSVYNTQLWESARVDEEEGTITIRMHGSEKPFVINKDDELYEYQLLNMQAVKQSVIKAYSPKPVNKSEENVAQEVEK